jgi:hypothetical protein
MRQHAVEPTLGKLLTDERLRERFLTAPQVAARQAGRYATGPLLAVARGSALFPCPESWP